VDYTPAFILAKKAMEQTATLSLPAHYLMRNKLLEQRSIFLWGAVEEHSSRQIVEQLVYLEMQQPGVPIHLYINCPGGMVTAGFAMYDMMQSVSSPVYTYCVGFAASMGSVILSGGQKGHRYIFPTAEVMIHQPAIGGFQANSADIEINARHIIRTKKLTASLLAANCNRTADQVMKDFDRDYWMTAAEALEYGIVDQVMPA
jgi:ATP-dependent Clp protease, protease subunit